MAKKKRKHKKHHGPILPKRPTKFRNFSECVSRLKKSVYTIARGRETLKDDKERINWVTLGTGFVAAPNRFVTAAHVIKILNRKKGLCLTRMAINIISLGMTMKVRYVEW